MLKRQIALLGTLLFSPRIPSRLELIKWAFLMREETTLSSDKTFFDFIPYKYGPFSFTLYNDLNYLRSFGYIENDTLKLSTSLYEESRDLLKRLSKSYIYSIRKILEKYSSYSEDDLIDYVYENYKWYASRSEIRSISFPLSNPQKGVIYTIGYEGKSIDKFFQKLLKTGIKNIVDVRNNPNSRKYGFSQKSLKRNCQKIDISYFHFADLGVPSSLRKPLNNFEDYQKLLAKYEKTVIPRTIETQNEVAEIAKNNPTALLCFEADIRCCHRTRLANALSKSSKMAINHIL